MQQWADKRAERCIATEMIGQDCSHCLGIFARLVGGHSALSGREHTGPLAHKAAVIFYNVTRQNPWQEGGRRRLVGRCYRPINVFKSKKLASPACPAPIDRPWIMKLLWDQPRGCPLVASSSALFVFKQAKHQNYTRFPVSLLPGLVLLIVLADHTALACHSVGP